MSCETTRTSTTPLYICNPQEGSGGGKTKPGRTPGASGDICSDSIGGMLVRASSRRLRQSGLPANGGGGCRVQFSPKRAAPTASAFSSADTDDPAGPAKKNVYNPPPLPISPLMDPNKYIPMSRRHVEKSQRPKGDKILPPREEALKINPYARILATDVRNDVDFHRRMPSWFLIQFTMLQHPETGDIHLVPNKIREDEEGQRALAHGKWAMNNKELLDLLEQRKAWRKLVGGQDINPKRTTWRKNMAVHVLNLLRERVRAEMEKLVWREIVEMPWDGEGVGCVLDWSKDEGAEDGKKECLISVKGKATPLHHMRTLLGDEMATELQAKMGIPEEAVRTGILLHVRSLKAQMWLMRIRAYLCIW